tara:strand:+ start:236 stop:700 length:465 start_codon:yes stop_codon:yes gene_type:complete
MCEWRDFKQMPKEGQVCWVWIKESYFDELLMEDYKEGMFVNIKDTDNFYGLREDGSIDKDVVEKNADNRLLFIDENGYVIGDGSGTDYYKWKPTTAQFHLNTWERDKFKQNAIDLYHKHHKDFNEEHKNSTRDDPYWYNVKFMNTEITTKVERG